MASRAAVAFPSLLRTFVLMLDTTLLPAVEYETAPSPDAALIFLHGLGDDGNGWSQIVPELRLPASLALRCIFPHAPVMPVSINNGFRMRAWYDIREADLSNRADLDGVRRSQGQVDALIARELGRGVAAERLLLGGFSQGGAIALYAGLRYPERLAAVIALSTYLIGADTLDVEASAMNRDVPIFMAHGTRDPVVQFHWADQSRQALQRGGWPVEWHTYPMEHAAVLEEIAALGEFIARVLKR